MSALRGRALPSLAARRLARPTVLVLVLLGVLGTPGTAAAHARLRKSEPAAGGRLVVSPRFIRLWFTEAPELSLTTIALVDSAGAPLHINRPERDPDGEMAVRVAVDSTLPPGRYTVRWRTAAADGHPSVGSFAFRVAAPVGSDTLAVAVPGSDSARAPSPADRSTEPAASNPAAAAWDAEATSPAFVVARAVAFAALLALIGAVMLRIAVLPRARELEQRVRDDIAATTASRAILVSIVFLAATVTRLYLQSRMMRGDAAQMQAMAMATHWGAAWRLQLGAGVLALIGFLLAARRLTVGWAIAAFASIALAASTALGAHAAAAQRLHIVSIIADALHVIGAAGWLGSLLWLVVVGISRYASSSEGHGPRVAVLVRAFSPAALSFAVLVTVTGATSAWLRLGTVSALWSTSYGQVLLLKLAVLAAVAGTGFHNWKRVQPTLGTNDATSRLARTATAELVIAFIVIIVTAVLVAMPTPVDIAMS